MKNQNKYRHLRVVNQEPRYPNAADNRYFARKAVDVMTAIVSGIGFTGAMVFLVTMV